MASHDDTAYNLHSERSRFCLPLLHPKDPHMRQANLTGFKTADLKLRWGNPERTIQVPDVD